MTGISNQLMAFFIVGFFKIKHYLLFASVNICKFTCDLQVAQKIFYLCPMAKQKRRSDCPVNFVVELFGDRWSFLIIRDLMFKGKHYYGEFLQSEEKIATNILADRLALLEQADIVVKKTDPEHGSKFIYKLSVKGIDMLPVMVEIIMWSAKHDEKTAVERKFVARVKKDREGLLHEIAGQLKEELAAG
jgi:DNA-binding HxlR family transcriptional regulator